LMYKVKKNWLVWLMTHQRKEKQRNSYCFIRWTKRHFANGSHAIHKKLTRKGKTHKDQVRKTCPRQSRLLFPFFILFSNVRGNHDNCFLFSFFSQGKRNRFARLMARLIENTQELKRNIKRYWCTK
jgi:hypothetical protein